MQKFVFYVPRHNSSSILFCCLLILAFALVYFSGTSGAGMPESKGACATLGCSIDVDRRPSLFIPKQAQMSLFSHSSDKSEKMGTKSPLGCFLAMKSNPTSLSY
jgi:hypothetical protein